MKRELQEDLDETAMVLAEIESEVERDQPALFKEWFLATDQQRAIMEVRRWSTRGAWFILAIDQHFERRLNSNSRRRS